MTDMYEEIVEAIIYYYKDEKDVLVDCLLDLMKLKNFKLSSVCANELEKMNRCSNCGCEMQLHTHKEWYNEVDPPCYEIVKDKFCPNCDIPSNGDLLGVLYGR